MKRPQTQAPEAIDESAESEITIHADGRVFAFGITACLARVLATIPTADPRMKRLLDRISGLNAQPEAREPLPGEEGQRCPSPRP